jgi:hypothetical protein
MSVERNIYQHPTVKKLIDAHTKQMQGMQDKFSAQDAIIRFVHDECAKSNLITRGGQGSRDTLKNIIDYLQLK